MTKDKIKPAEHGLIDYGFSAIQLLAPNLLGLNKGTRKIFNILGTGFLGINALTNTPAALQRVLPFKTHQKADIGFLAGLALLTVLKPLRKKNSLLFHVGFFSIALIHYILTDYDAKPR